MTEQAAGFLMEAWNLWSSHPHQILALAAATSFITTILAGESILRSRTGAKGKPAHNLLLAAGPATAALICLVALAAVEGAGAGRIAIITITPIAAMSAIYAVILRYTPKQEDTRSEAHRCDQLTQQIFPGIVQCIGCGELYPIQRLPIQGPPAQADGEMQRTPRDPEWARVMILPVMDRIIG